MHTHKRGDTQQEKSLNFVKMSKKERQKRVNTLRAT